MSAHPAGQNAGPTDETDTITTQGLITELTTAINRAGSQHKFARKHGVSQSLLSRTLTGAKTIDATLANALGYLKRVTYEFVPARRGDDRPCLSAPELVKELMTAVDHAGSQRQFARRNGLSQAIVSATATGRRGIDETVANALGYFKRTKVAYVPIRRRTDNPPANPAPRHQASPESGRGPGDGRIDTATISSSLSADVAMAAMTERAQARPEAEQGA